MTTVKRIYDYINEIAPFETQMDFDNSGILVGDNGQEVTSVIVTLDITKEVIKEAKDKGAELIISHHPVIFNPLKKLQADNVVYLLAQSGISAIAAHTNLDMANEIGVNATLAEYLNLKNIKTLSFYNNSPLLNFGELNRNYSPDEFARYVKEQLNCGCLRYVKGDRPIKTVAYCCGGAGDMIFEAISNAEVDAFISGDIRHHEMLAGKHSGITVIDAGHFGTEDIAIEPFAELLNKQFPEITFNKSDINKDIVSYI